VWVGRVAGLWITQGVLMARAHGGLDPALVKRLAGYAEMDRTMLIEDIGQNRPDVILVQREPEYDWMAWAMSDPALAAALSSYRLETTVGDIRILRRVNG
jgi:hypothetical protein